MAEKTENKYGIDDAAKIMGIEAASVRVRFRNAGIKKSGPSYGWASRGAMEKDIEKAGEAKPRAAKKTAKKAAPAKKPAKKAKASPAKKSKSNGDAASAAA